MLASCLAPAWFRVVAASRTLYVSHSGHDSEHCGGQTTPCLTISFAIGRSTWHDTISIDTHGGPYVNESDSTHTHISHTLTLTPTDGEGRAIINCQTPNKSSLFYIHQAAPSVDAKIPIVTLTGIAIRNCRQSTSLDASTIVVENAYLKIVDCEFLSNGVLLYHPWTANSTCDSVQLYIANSSFVSNQLSHPFRPAIGLRSCATVQMHAENVTFHASPVHVEAGASHLSVNFRLVTLDGGHAKRVSLYLTLADDTNEIVLSNCTVRDHAHGKNSAVAIAANNDTSHTPNIHMNHVTFTNNQNAKQTGGALSVFARFRPITPIAVGLKLSNCRFVNNSALRDGGAVYLENVRDVHMGACQFVNNTGVSGGAVYIKSGSNIVFTNTTFRGNRAVHPTDANYMTLGGAVYAAGAKLTITDCSFVENWARFSAQALYVVGAPGLVVQQSYFKDSSDYHASPQNTLVYIDSQTDDGYRMDADTQFANNVFNVTTTGQCGSVMDVKARVSEKGNDFWCPHGHHVEMQNIYAPMKAKYTYAHAVYWCRACPPDSYSLHRGRRSDANATRSVDMCLACPQKGYCENGRITARANHWGYVDKDYQLQFSVCPQGACCGREHCDTFRACAAHRRGVLCASCVRHHAVALHSRACVPEADCGRFSSVVLVVLVFGVVYGLVFLAVQLTAPSVSTQIQDLVGWLSSRMRVLCRKVRKRRQADGDAIIGDMDDSVLEGVASVDTETSEAAQMPAGKDHVVYTESALKIIFQFYQIMPIVYQLSDVNDARHSVTQTITDIFYLRPFFSLLSTFCVPPQLGNSGVLLVYLLSVALPVLLVCLVYAVGFVSLRVVRRLCHTLTARHDDALKSNCTGLFLYALLFSYVPLLRAVFDLLHCVDVADQRVLYTDASVACMQPWQIVLAVFGATTLVLLWLVVAIGLPLLRVEKIPAWQFLLATVLPVPMLAWWIWRHCVKPRVTDTPEEETTSAHRIVDVLETPFVSGAWWQSVLLLHALGVVALSEFLAHAPVVRALALVGACVVSLAVHATWRPFVSTAANRAETAVLGALAVFSVFGMHQAVLYSMGLLPTGSNQTLLDVYDWSYLAVSLWLPLIAAVGLLVLAARGLVKLTRCATRPCRGQ